MFLWDVRNWPLSITRKDEWSLLIFRCSFGADHARGSQMDREEEYLRNAAKAQRSALRAKTDVERANWLRLADGWLGLVQKHPQIDDSESLH
jgi:hypothetical protein